MGDIAGVRLFAYVMYKEYIRHSLTPLRHPLSHPILTPHRG